MKPFKILALLIEIIALVICGGWAQSEFQLTHAFPYEPVVVILITLAALIGTLLYWPSGDSDNKLPEKLSPSDQEKSPKILGNNDRKTNPKELVGRKDQLKELRSALQQHDKAALINGMGGIGKTTLAEAYVYQYGHHYEHVLWVEQTSSQLEDDFNADRTLLAHLGIIALEEDKQELFRQIVQKLKNLESTKNLLVIDNAEQGLERYLDKLPGHPNWHVLATSRYQMGQMHPVPLDFLNETEAIQLFNRETRGNLDQSLVKALVQMVEYHTLSITLLARTASLYDSDLDKLKTVFQKDLATNVSLKHAKHDKVEQVKAYLISIFNLSDLSEDQIWSLQQLACLPPDYYDFDWLKDWIQPEGILAEKFNMLLSELANQGWLLSRELHKQQWKLHRLIREVLLDKHPPKEHDVLPLIGSITSLLSIDQSKDNPIDKFQWIPYGKAALALYKSSTDAQIAELQNNLALVLRDLGDYEGAKGLLERALASDEQNFGPEHPNTAISSSNLALVLKALGDYEGAKGLLERALASDEQNFGPEHPNTARSCSNLATVLQDLGDYEGAKGLLERSLASDEQNFGSDHPSTARSSSNLAIVLRDLGDYEEARVLLERALASDEQNFGSDHPNTAIRCSNLALVLQALGDYEGAKGLLERALASAERNFGPEHPNTALSCSNLAMVLQALGDYNGAKGLLERGLASAERNFGPDHPTTANRYSNLATVLMELGEFRQALQLANRSLQISKSAYPPGHPYIKIDEDIVASIKTAMEM